MNKAFDFDKAESADFSDLGPADMAEALGKLLAGALGSTGLFELVDLSVAVGQIHILGRVAPPKEKQYVESIGFTLMKSMEDLNLGTFMFCKAYFLKNGKLKYGWQVSVGSDDLPVAVKSLVSAIRDAVMEREEDPPVYDPDTIPIFGSPERKGSVSAGKKGVSTL